PACQWIRGSRELKVQHALVLRRVRIALLQDVIAPREIAVKFATSSRRARDHKTPIPVVRQPQKEPRLVLWIGSDAGVELEARYGFCNRRAIGSARRNHGAIGLRREGARRKHRG